VEAPPPPPPPPAVQEFVVYFPFDKSILTSDAQAVVQQAAEYAKQGGTATIAVVGHTDTSGSVKYNLRLSERRAKSVADALVGLGVTQGELNVSWVGKTDLAVPTPDGVKEPLNRRTTITITPQGAMPK
jgi:outer membrane protein OmpA-like peptidoglycan-associated protein